MSPIRKLARSQRWLAAKRAILRRTPSLFSTLGWGGKDAIQCLTTAYQERDINLECLKADPLLDSVRSDARSPNWKKVGLP